METYNPKDKVYYGWKIGTHIQYQLTPYFYVGETSRGDYVLENIDNGATFQAKIICSIYDVI